MNDLEHEELQLIVNKVAAKLKVNAGWFNFCGCGDNLPGEERHLLLRALRNLTEEGTLIVFGLSDGKVDSIIHTALTIIRPKLTYGVVKVKWPTKLGDLTIITRA